MLKAKTIIELLFILLLLVGCFQSNLEKKEFYDNGNIKEKWSVNENGKVHDEYYSYYLNGNIEWIKNFNNGVLEGRFVHFFENGKKESEGYCKAGNVEGTSLKFRYYRDCKLNSVR